MNKNTETKIKTNAPAAWIIKQGSRTYYVGNDEFVRNSYDTGIFTPLYTHAEIILFTPSVIDKIYKAWHATGVDISGGNWDCFVKKLLNP